MNDRYDKAMQKLLHPPKPRVRRPGLKKAAASLHVSALGDGQSGHVYVVGFANYIKIGWSTDVRTRLVEVQSGVPELLVVHAIIPGNPADERALHRRFKARRIFGEWFRRDRAIADWIKAGCPL